MEESFKRKIIPIRYYNVMFYLFIETEDACQRFFYLHERMKSGDVKDMKSIFDWCYAHKIPLTTEFYYRKDFPISANAWNWLTYQRMKRNYETLKMPAGELKHLRSADRNSKRN